MRHTESTTSMSGESRAARKYAERLAGDLVGIFRSEFGDGLAADEAGEVSKSLSMVAQEIMDSQILDGKLDYQFSQRTLCHALSILRYQEGFLPGERAEYLRQHGRSLGNEAVWRESSMLGQLGGLEEFYTILEYDQAWKGSRLNQEWLHTEFQRRGVHISRRQLKDFLQHLRVALEKKGLYKSQPQFNWGPYRQTLIEIIAEVTAHSPTDRVNWQAVQDRFEQETGHRPSTSQLRAYAKWISQEGA